MYMWVYFETYYLIFLTINKAQMFANNRPQLIYECISQALDTAH